MSVKVESDRAIEHALMGEGFVREAEMHILGRHAQLGKGNDVG